MTRRAAATALGLVLVTAACSGSPTGSSPVPSLVDRTPAVAEVQRRTITSVITLDAQVISNPHFLIPAPASGVVVIEKGGVSRSIASAGKRTPVVLPPGAKAGGALVPGGSSVVKGLPLVSAVYPGFAIRATIPAERIYRLLDSLGPMRAQITNGPGPFACTPLGGLTPGAVADDQTTAPSETRTQQPSSAVPELTGATGMSVTCAAPASLSLLLGSPALLAITTGTAPNALAVPVEAVAGLTQQGTVGVITNGKIANRTVKLGLTDGRYIQVLDGLADNDQVSIPAPTMR